MIKSSTSRSPSTSTTSSWLKEIPSSASGWRKLAVMKGLDSIEEEHEFTLDCPACCFAAALLVPRGWLRRSLAEFGPDVEQLAELYVVPPRIIECRLLGESPAA